jgi:hypothetical protein
MTAPPLPAVRGRCPLRQGWPWVLATYLVAITPPGTDRDSGAFNFRPSVYSGDPCLSEDPFSWVVVNDRAVLTACPRASSLGVGVAIGVGHLLCQNQIPGIDRDGGAVKFRPLVNTCDPLERGSSFIGRC